VTTTLVESRRTMAAAQETMSDARDTMSDARATMDDVRATLGPLRSSAEVTEDIVRAPGEAVTRAARLIRDVGEGLADRARSRRKE
jgi:hypothetical protein